MSPPRSPPPAARGGTPLAQGRRSRSAPPALLSPAPPRALPRQRAHYPVHILSYATVAVSQQQNSELFRGAVATMFRWDETPLASAELQSTLLEVRRSTAGIERRHAARRRFLTTFGLVRFPEPGGHVVDLD